jgi:transcriptional regulator of arginine metabolism
MPTEHNQQEARRALIRTLLRKRKVRTQAELARQLQALGHLVTQSSVSRDLREMQVIKDPEGYHLPDDAPPVSSTPGAFEFIRSVSPAGANLLVVQTATGDAQRVAFELDRSGWPDIIGTISGDDTIFIATGGQAANRRLTARLEQAAAEHNHD